MNFATLGLKNQRKELGFTTAAGKGRGKFWKGECYRGRAPNCENDLGSDLWLKGTQVQQTPSSPDNGGRTE